MTRSVWKGPFVDGYLIKKADIVRESGRNDVIKTWAFIGDESFDEQADNQISLRRLIIPRENKYLVSFDIFLESDA